MASNNGDLDLELKAEIIIRQIQVEVLVERIDSI